MSVFSLYLFPHPLHGHPCTGCLTSVAKPRGRSAAMADKGALALAIAVGYVLGRHHKLRLATALVVAGVTRELRKGDGGLLKQGVKTLGTSPQLEEITDRL